MEYQSKALVVFELDCCAMMQKIVLFADFEAKDMGIPVDTGLKADDIELDDINT
jgi:hypothetical protein